MDEAPGASPGPAGAPLRVLLVASDWPSLVTGRLRQLHLLRGLGARHRVRLVCLAEPGLDVAHPPTLEGAAEVMVVPAAAPAAGRTRATRWLDRMRGVADPQVAALATVARRAAADEPVDVLLVAGRELGPVLGRLPPAPIVLDLCDARSARIRGQIDVAPLASRAAIAIRYLGERRYERSLVPRAGHVLVASERDRVALDAPGTTPISIVPNGVDTETWRRGSDRLGTAVAFSGAMDYAPNADAAVHLATAVMPLVWARRPEARLLVIGRDPLAAVRALASDPRVTVTGTVDDVRPYLDEAGVYAAPLRFAAGIQNKLLEAMAMAIPVVTTPVAAAGLEVRGVGPPPIAVATSTDDFAAAIVSALERRDADPTPDRAVRDYVETWFGWGRAVDLLEEVLVGAVEGSRA